MWTTNQINSAKKHYFKKIGENRWKIGKHEVSIIKGLPACDEKCWHYNNKTIWSIKNNQGKSDALFKIHWCSHIHRMLIETKPEYKKLIEREEYE